MKPENIGDQIVAMLELGAPEVDIDEVSQQSVAPSTVRRNGPLVGVGVLAVVLLVGLGLGLLRRPNTSTVLPAATTPPTSSITLGDGHLWPETPSQLSEVELAVAFARDVLGWEMAAGQAIFDDVSAEGSWIRVQQNVAVEEELLDVLVATAPEGGRVVMRAGTPWARGMELESDEAGVRVSLLRIAGELRAEALLRLDNGEYATASAQVTVGGDPTVSFAGIEPGSVRSGIVRYLNPDGSGYAAVGDAFEFPSGGEEALSCDVTVPENETSGPVVGGVPLPAPQGMAWVGGPGLATFLPAGGARWEDLPVSGERRTQKLFLWAEGYDWIAEPNPELLIDARPLDSTAPPALTSVSNGSRADWGSFMVVGVDLAPGCWTVDLEYKGSLLTFTVEVAE